MRFARGHMSLSITKMFSTLRKVEFNLKNLAVDSDLQVSGFTEWLEA